MSNPIDAHHTLGFIQSAPGCHIDQVGAKAGIYIMLAIAAAEAVAGVATYFLA